MNGYHIAECNKTPGGAMTLEEGQECFPVLECWISPLILCSVIHVVPHLLYGAVGFCTLPHHVSLQDLMGGHGLDPCILLNIQGWKTKTWLGATLFKRGMLEAGCNFNSTCWYLTYLNP